MLEFSENIFQIKIYKKQSKNPKKFLNITNKLYPRNKKAKNKFKYKFNIKNISLSFKRKFDIDKYK